MTNIVSAAKTSDIAPKNIYRSLDAWRGIAALWVVGSHVVGMLSLNRPDIYQQAYAKVLAQGFLGVEIFFVISGYCIAAAMASAMKRPQPIREFFVARVRRIFPPYLAALALLFVIVAIWRQFNPSGNPPTGELIPVSHLQSGLVYATNITLTQIAAKHPTLLPVAWTLSYEAGFYLICGLALATLGSRKPQWAFDALHVLTLITAGLCAAGFWRLVFPLDMWAYFGVGVLLFDVLRGTSTRKHAGLLIAVCALLGVFAVVHRGAMIGPQAHPVLKSVALIIGTVLGLWLLYRWDTKIAASPAIKILSFIGLFSYSLYLVHYFVLGFTIHLLGDYMNRFPSILVTTLLIAMVTILCYGFYWCTERPLLLKKAKKNSPVQSQ